MAKAHPICSGTLSATVTEFGASLVDLKLEGVDHSLVLGYPDVDNYVAHGQFMGAVIGRYANRIAGGRAIVANQAVQLETNEAGVNHLHGGAAGFAVQLWTLKEQGASYVVFELRSEAGDAGYPGNVVVTARYDIAEPATLRLTVKAQSDADTLINICHHPYFNLDGSDSIDQHQLLLNCQHYLPCDETLVPTGRVEAVDGGRFDYRNMRKVSAGQYNNTYCLHGQAQGNLLHAASVETEHQAMELWTTQPGLHVYDGYKIKYHAPGHDGRAYGPRAGLCLEAQAWPDSPNHSSFPDVSLAKDAEYVQTTEYRFRRRHPAADSDRLLVD